MRASVRILAIVETTTCTSASQFPLYERVETLVKDPIGTARCARLVIAGVRGRDARAP